MKTLIKTLVLFLVITASQRQGLANGLHSVYFAPEAEVDALFEQSHDVTFVLQETSLESFTKKELAGGDNKQLIAGIVALASWVTGIGVIIPFHRFILGVDGKGFKIFCMYFCTLSGCGFILLVDGILLVIDGDGNKYMNNRKFIMW